MFKFPNMLLFAFATTSCAQTSAPAHGRFTDLDGSTVVVADVSPDVASSEAPMGPISTKVSVACDETFEKDPCLILKRILHYTPRDPELACIDKLVPLRRRVENPSGAKCGVPEVATVSSGLSERDIVQCRLELFGETSEEADNKVVQWARRLDQCFRTEGFLCAGDRYVPAVAKRGYGVRLCKIGRMKEHPVRKPKYKNRSPELLCYYAELGESGLDRDTKLDAARCDGK